MTITFEEFIRKTTKKIEFREMTYMDITKNFTITLERKSTNKKYFNQLSYSNIFNRIFYEKEISNKMWLKLMKKIYFDYNLMNWKDEYNNYSVIDGTSWSLLIIYQKNKEIYKRGNNCYPSNYQKLIKELKKIIIS